MLAILTEVFHQLGVGSSDVIPEVFVEVVKRPVHYFFYVVLRLLLGQHLQLAYLFIPCLLYQLLQLLVKFL